MQNVSATGRSNMAMFWRVVWLTVRMIRTLWLVLAGLAFLAPFPLEKMDHTIEFSGFVGVAVVLAVCFTAGCLTLVFAGQREEGHDIRLLAMAIPPRVLLFASLTTALVGGIGIVACGAVSGLLLAGMPQMSLPSSGFNLDVASSFLFALPIPLLALTMSLLSRGMLRALCGSAVGLLVFGIISIMLLKTSGLDLNSVPIWCFVTATPIGLLLLNDRLIRRWTRFPFGAGGSRVANRVSELAEGAPKVGIYRSVAIRIAKTNASSSVRLLLALIWKEARSAWGFAITAAVYCVVGLIFGFIKGAPLSSAVFFSAACGAVAFQSEQKQRCVLFLSERGAKPRLVWAAKVMFWSGVVLLFAAIVLAIGSQSDSYRPWEPIDEKHPHAILHGLLLVETAFFIGQLFSICFRSRLVGIFLGIMSAPALLFWVELLIKAEVDLTMGLAPLAIVTSYVSLYRCRGWMNFRDDLKQYATVAGICAVGAIGGWAVPTLSNIYEISSPAAPPTGSVPKPESVLQLPTGPDYKAPTGTEIREAKEIDLRYASLLNKLSVTPKLYRTLQVVESVPWTKMPPEAVKWVADNQERIPRLLRIVAETRTQTTGLREPAILLLLDGLRLKHDGRLDDAMVRLVAAARLRSTDRWASTALMMPIAEIACHPDVTPAQIQAARKGIVDSLAARTPIEARIDELAALSVESANEWPSRSSSIAPFVFGRVARLNRTTEWTRARGQLRAREMRQALASPPQEFPKRFDAIFKEIGVSNNIVKGWHRDTSTWGQYVSTGEYIVSDLNALNEARAAFTLIEIAEHVREHGTLPTELDQIEVFRGKPFKWFPKGVGYDFSNIQLGNPWSSKELIHANTPFFYSSGYGQPAALPLLAPPPPGGGVPGRSLMPAYALPNNLLKQLK